MTRAELDAALVAAHKIGDKSQIAALYADAAARETTPGSKAFFLTQAYVFALEASSPLASELRDQLIELGAEPG